MGAAAETVYNICNMVANRFRYVYRVNEGNEIHCIRYVQKVLLSYGIRTPEHKEITDSFEANLLRRVKAARRGDTSLPHPKIFIYSEFMSRCTKKETCKALLFFMQCKLNEFSDKNLYLRDSRDDKQHMDKVLELLRSGSSVAFPFDPSKFLTFSDTSREVFLKQEAMDTVLPAYIEQHVKQTYFINSNDLKLPGIEARNKKCLLAQLLINCSEDQIREFIRDNQDAAYDLFIQEITANLLFFETGHSKICCYLDCLSAQHKKNAINKILHDSVQANDISHIFAMTKTILTSTSLYTPTQLQLLNAMLTAANPMSPGTTVLWLLAFHNSPLLKKIPHEIRPSLLTHEVLLSGPTHQDDRNRGKTVLRLLALHNSQLLEKIPPGILPSLLTHKVLLSGPTHQDDRNRGITVLWFLALHNSPLLMSIPPGILPSLLTLKVLLSGPTHQDNIHHGITVLWLLLLSNPPLLKIPSEILSSLLTPGVLGSGPTHQDSIQRGTTVLYLLAAKKFSSLSKLLRINKTIVPSLTHGALTAGPKNPNNIYSGATVSWQLESNYPGLLLEILAQKPALMTPDIFTPSISNQRSSYYCISVFWLIIRNNTGIIPPLLSTMFRDDDKIWHNCPMNQGHIDFMTTVRDLKNQHEKLLSDILGQKGLRPVRKRKFEFLAGSCQPQPPQKKRRCLAQKSWLPVGTAPAAAQSSLIPHRGSGVVGLPAPTRRPPLPIPLPQQQPMMAPDAPFYTDPMHAVNVEASDTGVAPPPPPPLPTGQNQYLRHQPFPPPPDAGLLTPTRRPLVPIPLPAAPHQRGLPPPPRYWLNQAVDAHKRGDIVMAVHSCNQAIKLYPNFIAAYDFREHIYRSMGHIIDDA